jgi:hypothetical protein
VPVVTSDLIEDVCRQFNQKGMTLEVVRLDPELSEVELRLDFVDVDCLDCVMPTDYLERLIASSLSKRAERAVDVTLHDPRNEAADGDAAGPATRPAEAQSATGRIIVLDPTGTGKAGDSDPGPAAGDLHGKTVLFRTDVLWRSWDWTVDEWSIPLKQAGATVLTWSRCQGIQGAEGRRVQAEYESLISSADVLISGLGNCGSCTSWTIRDALSGLNTGVPTLAVATEHFTRLASILAEDMFRPGLRILTLPYPLNSRPEGEVREIAREYFPAMLSAIGATV